MDGFEEIISVGVDVGTTTTQIVFSRLTVSRVVFGHQIPRIEITKREPIYSSGSYFTPLVDWDSIDVARLAEIIRQEYRLAGRSFEEVRTGAIIITGEAAKKKNAQEVLVTFSDFLGEFVVATAGPNLEGIIAGRGSGASQYSKEHFCRVTNVDVGGGNTNIAVFEEGKPVDTSALNVGGRLIELDEITGMVGNISSALQSLINRLSSPLRVGAKAELDELRRITDEMADLVAEVLYSSEPKEEARALLLTDPLQIIASEGVYMFSGGVSEYFYNPVEITSLAEVAVHGDVGPLLAQSLRRDKRIKALRVERPRELIRATVMGASAQTIFLSGSTIWVTEGVLPLKNLPVVRPVIDYSRFSAENLLEAIQAAVSRFDLNPREDLFAVALDGPPSYDYEDLHELKRGLTDFYLSQGESALPVVVVLKKDVAQALGQLLRARITNRPIIAVDQVSVEEGDYIDIGRPLADGRVVPLSVKTLVFPH